MTVQVTVTWKSVRKQKYLLTLFFHLIYFLPFTRPESGDQTSPSFLWKSPHRCDLRVSLRHPGANSGLSTSSHILLLLLLNLWRMKQFKIYIFKKTALFWCSPSCLIFAFVACAFGLIPKKLLLRQMSRSFPPSFLLGIL